MNYEEDRLQNHYLSRGFIETLILWIIHKQPIHGYKIKKKIEEVTIGNYLPKPGVIYTMLRRMEEKGLLRSEWKRETGRGKRVYYITEKGKFVLVTRLKIMKKRLKVLEQMVSYYEHVFEKEKENKSN